MCFGANLGCSCAGAGGKFGEWKSRVAAPPDAVAPFHEGQAASGNFGYPDSDSDSDSCLGPASYSIWAHKSIDASPAFPQNFNELTHTHTLIYIYSSVYVAFDIIL